MSDPAVEAAQRHVNTLPYGANGRLRGDDLVAAAREALKPIREQHWKKFHELVGKHPYCPTCFTDWPCATAKLVYPDDE